MSERMYPIQGGPSIPWRVIAPHDQQARHNHDQSLKRLAERGGLDPLEAACILEDRDWPRVGKEEIAEQRVAAIAKLNAINEKEDTLRAENARLTKRLEVMTTALEEITEKGCKYGCREGPRDEWCPSCVGSDALDRE